MTNYEKIKNMSIEELADFLICVSLWLYEGEAPKDVAIWLNEEVKE